MARYDDSQPYTPDYEDDCADCGEELPRGDLAWIGDDLVCAGCENERDDDERRRAREASELAELFATKEIPDDIYCPWCTDGIDPGDDWDALCEHPGCKPRALDGEPCEMETTAYGQGDL